MDLFAANKVGQLEIRLLQEPFGVIQKHAAQSVILAVRRRREHESAWFVGKNSLLFRSVPPRTFLLRHAYLLVMVDGLLRSEEHTSELQSHLNLVCRLLLEKKKH